MRVLHVYSGNLWGGVETALLTLARERHLVPAMEPHFAVCFDGRLAASLAAVGAPVHRLGAVRVSRPPSVWRARHALRAVLERGRFDVVLCHSAWPHAIFAPVIRRARLPLAFWLHDAATGRHWVERWAQLSPPDLVLCNSRFTAGTAPKLFPRVPNEVLYVPVAAPSSSADGGRRVDIRAELETVADATVIIQVSRMQPWKGHRLHLEALGRLTDHPGWICWQVGGPQRPQEAQYLDELRRLAARLGIAGRVRFLGSRSDIPRLLSAADIYCQPNLGPEPFGVSLLEALLAGLPVVTTALGAAPEIVDDTCGALVAPRDVLALADSLRRLIGDLPLRLKLGAGGRPRAGKLCDPAAQLRRLSEILAPASGTIQSRGKRWQKANPAAEVGGFSGVTPRG